MLMMNTNAHNLCWYDEFGNRLEGTKEGAFLAPWSICSAAQFGISDEIFQKLKFQYPSMKPIDKYKMGSNYGAFVITLPGVLSHLNQSRVSYRMLIDVRGYPHHKPLAYVFSPSDDEIKHCNIYNGGNFEIWPGQHLCLVDSDDSYYWSTLKGDDLLLFVTWLEQLSDVLNNPNINSPARGE